MRIGSPERASRPGAHVFPFLVSIPILVLLGYWFTQFLAAGRDDTFIMLWAGQSLGHGPWFVNYNYEPQEVASSIVGALIAAATKGMSVGRALLVIKATGFLSAIATLLVIWYKRHQLFPSETKAQWFACGAVVATAASPVFMYWSLGGLETAYHTLSLLLFCLALVGSVARRDSAGIDVPLLAVACLVILVRAESFWVVFLSAGLLFIAGRCVRVPAAAIRSTVLALAFFAVLLAVRHLFTGAIWPNPVYAKVGNFDTSIFYGWEYVRDYFSASPWSWIQGLAVLYGAYSLLRLFHASIKRVAVDDMLLLEATTGAIVIFHLLFVVATGGNWMEYFRFIAAIVPLMNLLVAFALVRVVRGSRRLGHAAGLILLALSLSQVWLSERMAWVAEGSFSRPIPVRDLLDVRKLTQAVVWNNVAHSRDMRAIEPFIENQLPAYLERSGGHLTVASFQAGFFPYHLRLRYEPDQVRFIDSAGLADLEIARIPGRKHTGGRADFDRIDLALMGQASLSEYFAAHPVDMIYQPIASQEARDNLAELGYELVWNVEGALVFYRDRSRSP